MERNIAGRQGGGRGGELTELTVLKIKKTPEKSVSHKAN